MDHDPLQANTKVGKVVAHLRRAILTGDIAPGEWLRQDELAEAFGVSATPVREALRHLAAEGLVEHIPHRGVRAVAYDMSVALDYYELRAILEPLAVRMAAQHLGENGLAALEQLLQDAQVALQKDDLARLTNLNNAFHTEIINRCGSRLLRDVLAFVKRSFHLDTLLLLPDRAVDSHNEHRAICEALRQGQAEQAADLMRTNIQNARAAMLQRLPSLGRAGKDGQSPDS